MRGVYVVLVAVMAATAATNAQKFLDVWKSPEVSRLNFAGKKVAALVITDNQSLQMSGEEALTRELTARGVNGVATYRFVPAPELRSAEKAKPWFEKAAAQGVVALRPVSLQRSRSSSPIVWTTGYYPSFWGYYGYGWSSVTIGPARENTRIVVETLIYDLTRDQLVWAAVSETQNPETLQDFVKDLVKKTVDEMKKAKLVG